MKFKDLANGMVFRFKFDERLGWDWWYTKYDDLDTICVKSDRDCDEYIGHRDSLPEELQEEEVILARNFSS
jgi:hypothetical protein